MLRTSLKRRRRAASQLTGTATGDVMLMIGRNTQSKIRVSSLLDLDGWLESIDDDGRIKLPWTEGSGRKASLMGLCSKQIFFERVDEVVRVNGGRLDLN